jgi:NitT/TauT family transport system ATP-binding protein
MSNPNQKIISAKNISHDFSDEKGVKHRALNDVSIEVAAGEFVSIVGPSGCGKSTLVRLMAGLIKPTHGEIDRQFMKPAMVFQDFALFPWLTVLENVEFGLKMAGLSVAKRRAIAREKIAEVGLDGHQNSHPHELSGGQRQRVSIARALAVSPDVLFMDEPFSSLDPFTANILKKDLLQIWERYKMTVVMVSHIVEDAILLSDRVVVMSSHPGRIMQTFSLATQARPRSNRNAEYFSLFDEINRAIRI